MSCPSAQNPLILTVSMGALPEGFCPANLQELANAIAQRIIIAPSEASLNIVGGSTEPASNVGPWFKNCEELNVFDDDLARYKPIAKGGFSEMQVFPASADFVVPDNIYKVMAEAWGGGGGGHSTNPGGGGAASGYGVVIRDVVPGQVIPVVVGMGGAPGSPGTAGGSSSVLGMTCTGGSAGGAVEPTPAGTVTGADFSIAGGTTYRTITDPTPGGDAPRGGGGGTFHNSSAAFAAGHAPGGGGCGAASVTAAGAGARGAVIIWF